MTARRPWADVLNIFGLCLLATLIDLAVLDWPVVSGIAPRFVIIPGSERADCKDISSHSTGRARAMPVMFVEAIVMAAIVEWLWIEDDRVGPR